MHVRVCVDCHEEYRPEVARCADCGGVLADRHDDEGTDGRAGWAPPATDSDRELADAHAIATSADARDLVPLADRLIETGVEFRIVAREVAGEDRPRGFELRVTDVDREAAVRAVAGLVGPTSGVTLLGVSWIPAAGEGGEAEVRCPACEAPVGVAATECPECSLGLEGERED